MSKQMLAVWGSSSSGKTVTSVKLAAYLAAQKKDVIIVSCDTAAPAIPTLVEDKRVDKATLGAVLEAPLLTQELILKNCVSMTKEPNITLLGYKMGENIFTYAEYAKDRAMDLLISLKHLADYVIVDCTSVLTNNILSTTALELADSVLRLCSNDLKAISYFASHLRILSDPRFSLEKHIKILSCARAGDGAEYENAFGGVSYRLPYVPAIEAQAASMTLTDNLSGKESKVYNRAIKDIAGEVFLDAV